jgi:hypothetical protein
MGNKPSNIFQMDRPESGGADRDEARENSGLLDRAKQEFAEGQKAKRAAPLPKEGSANESRDASGQAQRDANGNDAA